MRTPFVNTQAPSSSSKTQEKVEQKTADAKAGGKKPAPENNKAQNEAVKKQTLLKEKAPYFYLKNKKKPVSEIAHKGRV